MDVKLSDYINAERVLLDLKSTNKLDVLTEISQFAFDKGLVSDSDAVFEGLLAREGVISTAIGEGVAIPHARCQGVEGLFIIFARSQTGVEFDSLDGEPVFLFVTIIGPKDRDRDQLKILSRTARLLKHPDFRTKFLRAKSEEEALALVREGENWG
jgi:fructose-specific phosphotransferase system IIA component